MSTESSALFPAACAASDVFVVGAVTNQLLSTFPAPDLFERYAAPGSGAPQHQTLSTISISSFTALFNFNEQLHAGALVPEI